MRRLAYIIVPVIIYLVTAFLTLEANPLKWSLDIRSTFCLLTFIAMLPTFLFVKLGKTGPHRT